MSFHEHEHNLGFIEALPKPAEIDLESFYSRRYFQEEHGGYSNSYTEEELLHFELDASVARHIAESFKANEFLLDLGCGEAFFAAAFHRAKWKVQCYDFSSAGIERCNPQLIGFFRQGNLKDVGKPDWDSDVGLINLSNVLEHVIDPIAILTDIRRNLEGNRTILRIVVPNDYSKFQMHLVQRGVTSNTWFVPPEHLSYFNRTSLLELLSHCGFRILSFQADFPIEIFLANPHSNYVRNRKLGKGAHNARVAIQNFLISTDIDGYIKYAESAGNLGFGRDLVVYATVEE